MPNHILSTIALCTAALSGCAAPHDKAMHFVAGTAVATHTTKITGNPLAGCAAAFAAGIAKEAIDSRGYGHVDRNDALATAAGCVHVISF